MKRFYRLMPGGVCLLLLLVAVLSASTVFGDASAVSEIPENAEKVLVSRVIDGDTIQLYDGRRVRLIGVDTPETVHPQKGVEPYGKEASNFTRSMLEGREVYLEYDVQLADKYSRTLAYVWLEDDTFFNELLLLEGYAQVATFPPNVKYVERFLEAQKKAREAGKGLWSFESETPGQKESAKGGLSLTVDLKAELAVVKNVSKKPIDLAGYVLISVVGDQRFTFPPIMLEPGETATVTSGRNARHDPPRYLLWTKKYIWNDDGDPAELRSPDGELVASWP
ncbi:MAG: thermonuclease family protein [Acetomicrobium sp.]